MGSAAGLFRFFQHVGRHRARRDRCLRSPGEQDVIDDELAQALADWAGLRNVLVHLYLEVDQTRIWQILTGNLDQLESMAAAVAKATAGD